MSYNDDSRLDISDSIEGETEAELEIRTLKKELKDCMESKVRMAMTIEKLTRDTGPYGETVKELKLQRNLKDCREWIREAGHARDCSAWDSDEAKCNCGYDKLMEGGK